MRTSISKRERLVARMADHLLQAGLGASSLRALGGAAGVSDRMLIYYFGTRDALIVAVLDCIGERIEHALTEGPRLDRCDPERLVEILWARSRAPHLEPYFRLLVELAGAAMSQGDPYRAAARGMTERFVDWTAELLDIPDPQQRRRVAHRVVATLDGLKIAEAIGVNPDLESLDKARGSP